MSDHFTKPLPRILFYRHRDYYMGWIPPIYSPKYNDVARTHLVQDQPVRNTLSAAAAKTYAPWDIVLHAMYLMPLASVRSNDTGSLERGGVTDTFTTGTLDGTNVPCIDTY